MQAQKLIQSVRQEVRIVQYVHIAICVLVFFLAVFLAVVNRGPRAADPFGLVVLGLIISILVFYGRVMGRLADLAKAIAGAESVPGQAVAQCSDGGQSSN